jgi:hypothetical protein
MAVSGEPPLEVLRRDVERLAQKQRASSASIAAQVDTLCRELAAARDAATARAGGDDASAPGTPPLALQLVQARTRMKAALDAATAEQRDLGAAHARFGKSIERSLKLDYGRASNPAAFTGKARLLNDALVGHYYRHGRFELAERLVTVRMRKRSRRGCGPCLAEDRVGAGARRRRRTRPRRRGCASSFPRCTLLSTPLKRSTTSAPPLRTCASRVCATTYVMADMTTAVCVCLCLCACACVGRAQVGDAARGPARRT